MNTRMLKAARLARRVHLGQTRAHGTPYLEHPLAVARILWDDGHRDPDLICAAYLHDTVEDGDIGLDTITHLFGSRISSLVDAMTKRDGETLDAYMDRLYQTGGKDAVILKLADRQHNTSQLSLLPPAHPLHAKAAKKNSAITALASRALS